MRLDFKDCNEVQNMIKIIEKDKGLSAPDDIRFMVNPDNYKRRKFMDIFELREILKEADYPYLGASEEMWINNEKEELYMADMAKKEGYIDNCYKMLTRQRPGIEHGACLIGIKNKMGRELDIDEQDSIKEMTIQLCDKKLKELEKFL